MKLPHTHPRLTDRKALAAHRQRADLQHAGFLHDEAIVELQARLLEINRSFAKPALITAFPDYWRPFLPEARLIEPSETLELDSNSHDLIIHAMALHWSDDPVGQIVQCHRALLPDGLFLSVAFGGATLIELRQALAEAEARVSGGLSPRVVPMADLRDMGGLLQRAGLKLPVADSAKTKVSYQNSVALMHDLRAMGETNALADRNRKPCSRQLFVALEEIYREKFADETGRLRATFELVFLAGWAPHESQQQPLRPGSSQTRLADALKTVEYDEDLTPVAPQRDRS